ncbi:C-terminal binding protein [Leucobacter allii]|uniref:C-terminal binding protein n=1 Tax=Leucobacter allii TaxID=2932247 RepID=A0ABY4FMC9_9MICO|nr:C-terminal binding protein [Leucobacter allii]UOQ57437.1 C-terminal binding protein [Leucobacter allii]
MSAFRVLITDYTWDDASRERAILEPLGAEVIEAPDGSEETLVALAPGVDAILTCFARVTERVIDAAGPGLAVVARYGVGVDNIAVAHAQARGVAVTRVPEYCVDEVAEHALALMLALERGLTVYDRDTRSGGAALRTGLGTRRIAGRTVGIIGAGRIGEALRTRVEALGMTALVYHPSRPDPERLRAVLGAADYVSLHLPLLPGTQGLVDADFLAAMRPDAFLINASRGPLVDTDALVAALRDGRIAGAGLDVTDPEDLPPEHPLRAEPRVIITPHTAFYSAESIASLAEQAAASVAAVLAGARPASLVPAVAEG